MRLIDADELIKQIEADAEHIETPLAKMFLYANISDIKHAPTIAQPEIIRCKDCKKYDMHDHRCKHWNHGVVVMDWCSKAERR